MPHPVFPRPRLECFDGGSHAARVTQRRSTVSNMTRTQIGETHDAIDSGTGNAVSSAARHKLHGAARSDRAPALRRRRRPEPAKPAPAR
jgi:hypothetical protein